MLFRFLLVVFFISVFCSCSIDNSNDYYKLVYGYSEDVSIYDYCSNQNLSEYDKALLYIDISYIHYDTNLKLVTYSNDGILYYGVIVPIYRHGVVIHAIDINRKVSTSLMDTIHFYSIDISNYDYVETTSIYLD